jgi:exosortase
LSDLSQRWLNEVDYNHGFLVPVFSAYLLHARRSLRPKSTQLSRWAMISGVVLILLAGFFRMSSAYFQHALLQPMSLLPCLAGVSLLCGGWSMLRWTWPSILFLGFMIPLPGFLTGQLSHPLQRFATIGSTYVLQTFGLPAVDVGNVIRLTDGEIGVVEACSGLRMMMAFFAITVGASFLIERPLWEKVLIVLSAVIIAVLANIIRITATGLAHEYFGPEAAERVFHNLAGWLMMPLAMLLLYCEMWLVSRLLTPVRAEEPLQRPDSRRMSSRTKR